MKKVSSKTHTKKQLDDYANQNNPNNKAYKSRKMNEKRMKSKKKSSHSYDAGSFDLEWFCYGNPFDFEWFIKKASYRKKDAFFL